MFIFFSLIFAFSDYDALCKAESMGFFYKNVDVTLSETCAGADFCVEEGKEKQAIKKKDKVTVIAEIKGDMLEITIEPDKDFVSYYIFIREPGIVRKIKMQGRKVSVANPKNIIGFQLTGTGVSGPVVLYNRVFKTPQEYKFEKDIAVSINKLRTSLGLAPFAIEKGFEAAAKKSLGRIAKEWLVHYSSTDGGIRQTGIRTEIVGENLFNAATSEKGWKMMVDSPSHLYNILSRDYKKFWVETVTTKLGISGAVIFGN